MASVRQLSQWYFLPVAVTYSAELVRPEFRIAPRSDFSDVLGLVPDANLLEFANWKCGIQALKLLKNLLVVANNSRSVPVTIKQRHSKATIHVGNVRERGCQ
jgi:hypothetical protein